MGLSAWMDTRMVSETRRERRFIYRDSNPTLNHSAPGTLLDSTSPFLRDGNRTVRIPKTRASQTRTHCDRVQGSGVLRERGVPAREGDDGDDGSKKKARAEDGGDDAGGAGTGNASNNTTSRSATRKSATVKNTPGSRKGVSRNRHCEFPENCGRSTVGYAAGLVHRVLR
jgi:hypothetical protein